MNEEDDMDDQQRRTIESVQATARTVADGVGDAAERVASTARDAGEGVAEFRAVIRRQPITMAFVMLGMGYLLGRIAGGARHWTHRQA
jgi:hypothetical protein